MSNQSYPISGAGLGLRRSFIDELLQREEKVAEFLEVAPENWMEMGGSLGKKICSSNCALSYDMPWFISLNW
jgi:hypothetical protein